MNWTWEELNEKLKSSFNVIQFYLSFAYDDRFGIEEQLKYKMIADNLQDYVADQLPDGLRQRVYDAVMSYEEKFNSDEK